MAIVKNKKNRKKLLFSSGAVLVFLVLLVGYHSFIGLPFISTDDSDSGSQVSGPSAPTKDEIKAGDDIKNEIVNEGVRNGDPAANPDSKKKVNVLITDAGQYGDIVEIRALISNYYQTGTCTHTLTKDNHSIVKTVPANPDISTTICGNTSIKRSEFPTAGDWTLVVNYTSSDATGQSSQQKVTIN